ncbi:hypothetical protein LA080_015230 [Diaporthe eres]|uniref:Bromo domain-containing protein n=1 Tax=Diaporthe vaccinii TaxID=105482 RepID=A0ABR4F051_9PEZI|nr:hypothetical protein LA080_015230 [Diaporthe eres]
METKRKASAAGRGGGADGGEPAAKRRKLPSDFPDLAKHESPESTTAYGLAFLEAIRKTADKHGRGVAGYFEKLLPKEGNEDYYRRIHMPVSLRVIERRLYRHELANMTQLESWMKRMVNNAKEFYSRGSQTYEDAERVRKATSNYMVKTNPAYKKITNYAATPAPAPPDWDVDAEIAAEDMPSELAASDVASRPPRPPQHQHPEGEEDAEGEDEEMPDADAEGDADDGDAAEGDADISRGSNTRIVLKRRGARSNETEGTPEARSTSENKGGAEFSEVPYQGLSFQQAQEKLVDELSTRQEEDDEWPYFEPFINLPPKSLKDYYQLIDEPMSLKKLWRAIKGMVGRAGATGVSEFKSWAALEEKASLLWSNAFYYNEEGSEIFELAKELKDAFYEQLNEAKACVEEPPQPKIILRAPSAQTPQAQSGRPKRITIHVGGGREGSQGSPAPQASHPGPAQGAVEGAVNGATTRPAPVNPVAANLSQVPGPGTPSAVMKREDSNRASPTVPPPMNNGYSSSAFRPVMLPPASGLGQPAPQHGPPNGHVPGQQQQAAALYDFTFRSPGVGLSEAILANLCLRTPPDNGADKQFVFNVPPHPKLLQQSFTVNLAANQWKLQIVPRVSPVLEQQQRPYKLYVVVNGQTLARGVPTPRDTLQNGELLYDAQLHQGVNTIVLQMIAALPKGQKLPNGSDAVLEKVTILANVMKQY